MKIENDKQKFKRMFKQRIYFFVVQLVQAIDVLAKDVSSQVIAKQLLKSGTSIGANYIEAQGSSSKKDFTNFLHYSLKSANESLFWLTLLRDTKKCNKQQVNSLLDELSQISKILASSILTIKGKRNY